MTTAAGAADDRCSESILSTGEGADQGDPVDEILAGRAQSVSVACAGSKSGHLHLIIPLEDRFMRRFVLTAILAGFMLPAVAAAQLPRIMAGGGFSNPIGDFNDMVDPGYHGRVGLQLGAPAFPLAGRLEGAYHSFGQLDGGAKITVLNGALSAVLELQGTGLTPYFLAGVGRYRVKQELGTLEATGTETGVHGGFGVNIGALGFGGFVEIRVVQINGDDEHTRYFPVSVGFRL